jgi:tRNA 2-thiouridine synthesizing protein A
VEYQVDATGLKCPEPVMILHAAIRKVSPGDIVCLTATDPSTPRDVAKFCDFLGHELLEHYQDQTRSLFRVKKAG